MVEGGFIEQFAEGVFGPEDIGLMQTAFDDAWRRVQVSNAPYGAEEYASAGRAILAKQSGRT